jgi:hypothetical protein
MGRSLGALRRAVFGTAIAAVTLLAAVPARAGEIQGALGGGGMLSSWRGDGGVGSSLRLGYRFGDLVAIDALTRLGYATVDERMITYLSLGATLYGKIGKVRPYGRLAAVHQHEESLSVVRNDPFGAVFGVGDGIRHRGGVSAALGAEVAFHKSGATEWFAGADLAGTHFVDPRGPRWYAMLGVWLGVNYSL